jgi:hypothetical protein
VDEKLGVGGCGKQEQGEENVGKEWVHETMVDAQR